MSALAERIAGRRVGIALAAGAARGWAHLGALAALEEQGVKPAFVAGTSIGAFVGGCYASGRMGELRSLVEGMDRKRVRSFLDVVFPRTGVVDGARLMEVMRSRLFLPSFEDLPLPFRSVATDLRRGVEVVSGSGDLSEAVRASISIPGIFTPVLKGDALLVDGALVNPLPVSVVRAMGADFVIAVDLTHGLVDTTGRGEGGLIPGPSLQPDREEGWVRRVAEKARDLFRSREKVEYRKVRREASLPTLFEVVLASYQLMEVQVVRTRLAVEPADLLIRPRVGHIGLMEFHRGAEASAEGRRAALEAMAG